MFAIESLGQFHDFLRFVFLHAPNDLARDFLPLERQLDLQESFDLLKQGFHYVARRVKDENKVEVLNCMLDMALEAYRGGNKMEGAHILQEFEGIVWPSLMRPVNYERIAQTRVTANKEHRAEKGHE